MLVNQVVFNAVIEKSLARLSRSRGVAHHSPSPSCPVRVIPHSGAGMSSAPGPQAQSGCRPHKFATHALFFVMRRLEPRDGESVRCLVEVSRIPPRKWRNGSLLKRLSAERYEIAVQSQCLSLATGVHVKSLFYWMLRSLLMCPS